MASLVYTFYQKKKHQLKHIFQKQTLDYTSKSLLYRVELVVYTIRAVVDLLNLVRDSFQISK